MAEDRKSTGLKALQASLSQHLFVKTAKVYQNKVKGILQSVSRMDIWEAYCAFLYKKGGHSHLMRAEVDQQLGKVLNKWK